MSVPGGRRQSRRQYDSVRVGMFTATCVLTSLLALSPGLSQRDGVINTDDLEGLREFLPRNGR